MCIGWYVFDYKLLKTNDSVLIWLYWIELMSRSKDFEGE